MRRDRLLPLLALTVGAALSLAGTAHGQDAKPAFAFRDVAGQHLDVLIDGKVAVRYMYAHDPAAAADKARRAETYKPYLHVFDADGKEPITQGAGGKQFPHHRGIYIGWQKLGFEGKRYNFWEMASGDIVHQQFAAQKADADSATFTSVTTWVPTGSDKPVVEEERTTTVRRAPAPGRLVIDFASKLTAPNGDVVLDGDPEHGGIQYRPAGELKTSETVYTYPVANADPHKDTDYPWVGQTYSLRGKRYSVVDINHPQNPKGTRVSAYRDYGRFGMFPKAEVKKGQSLTVRYRFVIADGEMPPAETIQKWADDFAGAASPTPAPQTTVKPAEGAGKAPAGSKKAAATKPADVKPAPK